MKAGRKRFVRTRDALTAIVPVNSDALRELEQRLGELGAPIKKQPRGFHFDRLRMPHFLSWVLLPGTRDEEDLEGPPRLLFEANFHGEAEAFLDELHRAMGQALTDKFYRHCGLSEQADLPVFKEFFRAQAVKPALLFQSYPGLSPRMIENDDKVRQYLHEKLAKDPPRIRAMGSEDERIDSLVMECQQRVLRAVQERGGSKAGHPLDFSVAPPGRFARIKDTPLMKYVRNVPILPVAFVALVLLAHEVVRTAMVDWRQRRGNGALPPAVPGPEAAEKARERKQILERIQRQEDCQEQNHLALYVELKPGALRHITLRLILFGWNYLAKHYFTEGSLAGIEGIHFARWVIVDGGRRSWPAPKAGRPRWWPRLSRKRFGLVFLSNYDGSWEAYLDNFIDRASLGLTTIWCNTQGFPKTRLRWNSTGKFPYFRIEMGAQREEEFKQWVRGTQVPTSVWYSRYPDMSVANIRRNRDIRALAAVELDAKKRRTWLQWL